MDFESRQGGVHRPSKETARKNNSFAFSFFNFFVFLEVLEVEIAMILMDFDGFRWSLMDFDGFCWILIDFDRFW